MCPRWKPQSFHILIMEVIGHHFGYIYSLDMRQSTQPTYKQRVTAPFIEERCIKGFVGIILKPPHRYPKGEAFIDQYGLVG